MKDKKDQNNKKISRREKKNDFNAYISQSKPGLIAGSFCRFLTALSGAFGLCLMFNDSFRFTGGELDALRIFLICLVFSAVWYVIVIAKNTSRAFFISAVSVLSAAALFIAVRFGFSVIFFRAPVTMWNHAIYRLASGGFSSLSYFSADVPGTDPLTEEGGLLTLYAFITFCALISFIFIISTVRKARLMPVIIASAAVMTVSFTYNIITENFAFLFLVSSAVGLLTLKYCDSFVIRKKHRRSAAEDGKKGAERKKAAYAERRFDLRAASLSGTAGFLAAAMVFAIGAYPAKTVTEPVGVIGAFKGIISEAREFFYGFISGDALTGESGPLLTAGGDSPVRPERRVFNDDEYFSVSSPFDVPVYLKSRVLYEFSDSKWNSNAPSSGTSGDTYMSEQMTELFCRIVGINERSIENYGQGDAGGAAHGFVSAYIDIKNLGVKTDSFYLPQRFSPYYGLLEGGKNHAFVPYNNKYRIFGGSGMMVKNSADKSDYAAVASLPIYKADDFIENFKKDLIIYDAAVRQLSALIELVGSDPGRVTAKYMSDRSREMIDNANAELKKYDKDLTLPENCILYKIPGMTYDDVMKIADELEKAGKISADAYAKCRKVPSDELGYLSADMAKIMEPYYEDHGVNSSSSAPVYYYSSSSSSSSVLTGMNKADTFEEICYAVYGIVDYLSENTEYTLEPHGYRDDLSYVYQFLHTAKNGYCVQYATAAVLLLRSCGISARYAEGFLASDFKKGRDSYECTVLDSNAHSWIEVFVPGYGWMTFEVTEPMTAALYGDTDPRNGHEHTVTTDPVETALVPYETDYHDETRIPEETDAVTDPVTTEPAVGPVKPFSISYRVIIPAAVFTVLITLFGAYLTYNKNKREKLKGSLEKAAKGGADRPYQQTLYYSKYILEILKILGIERRKNELVSGFVKRAEEELGEKIGFSAAAEAAQKAAFSGDADKNDCAATAKCALALMKKARYRLTGFKKFKYVTIRKFI